MSAIDWKAVKMVVFDVDGTLYNQQALRKKMLRKLLLHYGMRPWFAKELKVLQQFRRIREEHAGEEVSGLEQEQYRWCAKKTRMSPERIRLIVERWMQEIPLPLLSRFVYPGLPALMDTLAERSIIRAVYSDYPYEEKMKHMGLNFDRGLASTDANVNALKPNPKGLQLLLDQNGLKPELCVFIGDREERDGVCAKAVGMPYLIIDKKSNDYFVKLTQEIRGEQR